MIEIVWLDEQSFKIDWAKDKSIVGQNVEIMQQLFALLMGWA